MNSEVVLDIKSVSHSYGNLKVLDKISFRVTKGSFSTIIGPSGCGKTTLLRLITGTLQVQDGSIQYNSDSPVFSIVFQRDSLLPWLTLSENIMLPLSLHNQAIMQNDMQNVSTIIKHVGLQGFEHYYPSQLSGGMCKRAELARALMTNASLLILDEPFSSLDVLTRERLNVLLYDLCKSAHKTIILVTHSIEEACYLSESVHILSMQPSKIIQSINIHKQNHHFSTYILSDSESMAENNIRKLTEREWNDPASLINIHKQTDYHFSKREFLGNLLLHSTIFFIFFSLLKFIFNFPDYFYPYPYKILFRCFYLLTSGYIFNHIAATVLASFSGFFIAFIFTTIAAYCIASSTFVYKWTLPSLLAANSIPTIAIAPILINWFGFGITPKIIISSIIVFFPMLINSIAAFSQVRRDYKDLIILFKPSILKRLIHIEFPGALPLILTGVKVSSTLSVIGAVVGEFMAGSLGLGALINTAKNNMDYTLMYSGVVYLVLISMLYYSISVSITEYLTLYQTKKH